MNAFHETINRPSRNWLLDEDDSPEFVLGSEQGETFAGLGIELA